MTATAPTNQHDLDYAFEVAREMSDDFRFTVEDIDADLLRGATEYARQYTGTFDFMREMKVAALKRAWLTEGQAKGVMNCIMANVRKERRDSQPRERVDFSGLRALFARAAEHLQRPRIVLQDDNGQPINIKLATSGKHPGAINFTTGTFEFGQWFGRVEVDGTLVPGRDMTPAVKALIQELSVDPVAAAKRHAHLTGNCCFCNRKLDDARSTAAGYGPICADHYGLPWGE